MKLSQIHLKYWLGGLGMLAVVILAYTLINQQPSGPAVSAPTSTPTESRPTQQDYNPETTDIPTMAAINPLNSLATSDGSAGQPPAAGSAALSTSQPGSTPQPTTAPAGGSSGGLAPTATQASASSGGTAPTRTSTRQATPQASATPQGNSTSQPTPTTQPTTVPPQGGFSFTFLSSPVAVGAFASAIINTDPAADCAISYTPPGGTEVSDPALAARQADVHGVCSWSWLIAQGTASGTGTVKISANGLTQSYPITIQ
jgi:hypothetical protein